MNVLFVSHDASRTGAPLALLQELNYIKECYKSISFKLLLLNDGVLRESFEKMCFVYPAWRNRTILTRLLRKFWQKRVDSPYLYQFKKGQFDVVYANTVASFKVAIELKRKFNIPLIGHVHESENLLYFLGLTKGQLEEFDKLIAVSDLTKKNLVNLYAYPDYKIIIQHPISYWIDHVEKNNIEIKPVDLSSDKFMIGVFCNGSWWKGTEIIPLMVKNFHEKYHLSDSEFCVVGKMDNLTRYHLEYDLRKMNVNSNIYWVGEVNNPLIYHARFDIFLLLSREDSNPLAAQEAAFMGKPIIGFEGVTGATEWICKGAGTLVPYMDLDKISDEIYKYYADEKLRREVGRKAKEVVTELYLKDSQMLNILELINEYR